MDSQSPRGRKSVHFETSAELAAATTRADGTTASSTASPRYSADASGESDNMTNNNNNTHAQNAAAAAAAAAASIEGPFQLTRDDVYTAFQFFDPAGTGVLQMANLKPRLSPFFPDMTMKEYRFLLEEPSIGSSGSGTDGRAATADDSAAHGLTAAQLWDLIDNFQRLYLNPAMAEKRQMAINAAVTTANTTANSGSPSTSPRGNAGRRTGAAATRATTSPDRSPQRRNPKLSPRSGAASAGAAGAGPSFGGSGSLRSNSLAPPPSIMFDVLHGYDPVREAFDVYDPAHTGAVEVGVLGQIMARIGFGELSAEELTLLVRTADFDRDGKISLSDFRRLVNMKERFKKKKKTAGR